MRTTTTCVRLLASRPPRSTFRAVLLSAVMVLVAVQASYTTPTNVGSGHGEMCRAQFTSDGTPDLFISAQTRFLFISELGEQVFPVPKRDYSNVICVDVVGSAHVDALSSRDHFVSVFKNDGHGTLEQIDIRTNLANDCVTTRDVDGDGKMDVLLCGTGGVHIMHGTDGEGAFSSLVLLDTRATKSLAWIDLDGDGDADDLVLGTTSGLAVRASDGAGSFLPSTNTARVGNSVMAQLWVGDFTADGVPRDVVTVMGSGELVHYDVHTDGTVRVVKTALTRTYLYRLAVFDADGDARPDVLMTAYTARKLILARSLADGTGWSMTEYGTGSMPRVALPTFDTLTDGVVDMLVLGQSGVLKMVSLTGTEQCPLASPLEWEGSDLPRHLPALEEWTLRASEVTAVVAWDRMVTGRTMAAYIAPLAGEDPTCVLSAPEMRVDDCAVEARGVLNLGDLVSGECGGYSRRVDVNADRVSIVFSVVAHSVDVVPRTLGNGAVINHESSFTSQLLCGFTFPLSVSTTFGQMELFGPAWITALFKDAVATQAAGFVRLTYEFYSPPDTRLVLNSASCVRDATMSECAVSARPEGDLCVNVFSALVFVCDGSKTMELDLSVYCGDTLCPGGHHTLTTTAEITQQKDLCDEYIEDIVIEAVSTVHEGEDVVVIGGDVRGHTTLRGKDSNGFPVGIVAATLRHVHLCARHDTHAAGTNPCHGAPHQIVAMENGDVLAGTEALNVRVDMRAGERGALLVDVALTLDSGVITEQWAGLELHVALTLGDIEIASAPPATRGAGEPRIDAQRRETEVFFSTTLGGPSSAAGRARGSAALAAGALVLATVLVL